MQAKYQDVMAVFYKYRKSDRFITFTANPNWIEITPCLYSEQCSWMCLELTVHSENKDLIHDY